MLRTWGVESVEIEDDSFTNCSETVFEDLNDLKSLKIGKEVFRGNEEEYNACVMKSK